MLGLTSAEMAPETALGRKRGGQQEDVDFPPEVRASAALAVVNARGKGKRQENLDFCALQPRKSSTHGWSRV